MFVRVLMRLFGQTESGRGPGLYPLSCPTAAERELAQPLGCNSELSALYNLRTLFRAALDCEEDGFGLIRPRPVVTLEYFSDKVKQNFSVLSEWTKAQELSSEPADNQSQIPDEALEVLRLFRQNFDEKGPLVEMKRIYRTYLEHHREKSSSSENGVNQLEAESDTSLNDKFVQQGKLFIVACRDIIKQIDSLIEVLPEKQRGEQAPNGTDVAVN